MSRVLLTDDEVEFVDSMAKVLRRRGLDVEVAYEGVAALAAVGRERFDVVVLDLRMPRMDGLETLAAIRRRDPQVCVILLTGHADVECVQAALRGGADHYLLKPCSVDDLTAAIEDGCEHTGLAREAARTRG
ncbi:MAG: response regulator [Deltaproteobacteria bacterium]|nr:response regulator [Deltaproteobacteria bacterium]